MSDIQEGSTEPLDPLDHPPGVVATPTFPIQPHEVTQPLVLVVPWLHPEMASVTLPAGVRFLDPVTSPAGTPENPPENPPDRWRPPDVPLTEGMASAFLRESAAFALERGRSRGALNANALAGNDFYSGSALSIQAALTGGAPSRDDPAMRSQRILLLAWQAEEQILELRRLDQQVQAGWRDLDATLGVDDTDGIGDLSGGRLPVVPEDLESALPWRLVLEALLFFMPQDTLLVTSHREIVDLLADIPDCPAADPPGKISGFPDSWRTNGSAGMARVVRVPGWKLAGATRRPGNKPWLEPDRVVICLDPAGFAPVGSATRAVPETNPGAHTL